MDYLSIKSDELRGVDANELKSAEREVRKQLAELRMDVYTASAVNSGKSRRLKKTLARILTVKNQGTKAQQAN
ncbi:MAG: 50S ribosomal protein L29 [Oligoflexus sp.]